MTAVADVEGRLHEQSATLSYIVADLAARRCAVIDPALDFDMASGRTGTAFADALIAAVKAADLVCDWVLETHIHADHLTAAPYLKAALGAKVAAGFNVTATQKTFAPVFDVPAEDIAPAACFDHLLADGETFAIGGLTGRAIWTPGHTPGCMSYLIGDALFVGDTIFMPDAGSARCDFPGGDARTLYRSIQKLYALPGETRVFVCHDYKAPGRDEVAWRTTIAEQRTRNIHITAETSEDAFAKFRVERDATLAVPRLLLPAIQVNIRGGRMPAPDAQGRRFLRIPIDVI